MSINKTYVEGKAKKRRPFGVWILTIYALLYGGVFRLISSAALDVLQGYTAFYREDQVRVFFVYAFLSISIVITSVLTWRGLEVGRKFFLVITTLFFLGDGIDEFGWGTQIPDWGNARMWIRYITDFMFPLLCIWYFNKPSVKEFFRKVEKDA